MNRKAGGSRGLPRQHARPLKRRREVGVCVRDAPHLIIVAICGPIHARASPVPRQCRDPRGTTLIHDNTRKSLSPRPRSRRTLHPPTLPRPPPADTPAPPTPGPPPATPPHLADVLPPPRPLLVPPIDEPAARRMAHRHHPEPRRVRGRARPGPHPVALLHVDPHHHREAEPARHRRRAVELRLRLALPGEVLGPRVVQQRRQRRVLRHPVRRDPHPNGSPGSRVRA
jgi:hypothetical protein